MSYIIKEIGNAAKIFKESGESVDIMNALLKDSVYRAGSIRSHNSGLCSDWNLGWVDFEIIGTDKDRTKILTEAKEILAGAGYNANFSFDPAGAPYVTANTKDNIVDVNYRLGENGKNPYVALKMIKTLQANEGLTPKDGKIVDKIAIKLVYDRDV